MARCIFYLICLLYVGGIGAEALSSQAPEHAKSVGEASTENDGVIAAYQKALRGSPGSAPLWNNLGAAFFSQGKYNQASDAFAHAAELDPQNADYEFNGGLAFVRCGKCELAKSRLQKAGSTSGYKARAEFLLGACSFADEQWQTAREEIDRATSDGFASAEAFYMLVIASRKTHDRASAQRAYNLLSTNYPDSPLIHELLGEALDRGNQASEARDEIAKAIESNPGAPGLHGQLGLLLLKVQDLPAAKIAFQQELAIDAHSFWSMRYLGEIAERSGQFDVAHNWYVSAVREKPSFDEGHYALGRLLAQQENYSEALPELQLSLPGMDADATVHYWLERTLRKLGRKNEADKELARVRQIRDAERLNLLQRFSGETPGS